MKSTFYDVNVLLVFMFLNICFLDYLCNFLVGKVENNMFFYY